MDNGLFEVLASVDAQEQEKVAATHAVIAAQTRAVERFEKYVSAAATQDERDARIGVIAADLDGILANVVDEYGSDIEMLRNAATVALGGGHPADCTCGFCENKGNLPGAEKKEDDGDEDDEPMEEKEASVVKTACPDCTEDEECDECRAKKTSRVDVRQASASASEFPWEHVAADVETGDTYAQERVDLPSNKTDGLGGPSPKIDKGNSGDETGWNLQPIDVPSERHPSEQQSATDRADYDSKDFDPSSPVRDRIDADAPLQPEHNVADKTETWTGTEGQASPVTSNVLAKWTVLP